MAMTGEASGGQAASVRAPVRALLPGAVATALAAGGAAWYRGTRPGHLLLQAVVTALWAGAGAVLLTRSPVRRLGALVAGMSVTAGVAVLATAGAAGAARGSGRAVVDLLGPVALALLPAFGFHCVLALPSGRLGSAPRRVAVGVAYGVGLGVGIGLWTVRPGLPWGAVAAEAGVLLLLAAPAANHRYRTAAAVERQRMQWVGCATAVLAELAVVLGALRALVGWPRALVPVLLGCSALLPAALVAGVSRRLAGRADRVLVSTVSATGLSGVVLGVYLFIVIGLGGTPGSQDRTLVILSMAAAVTAALVYPRTRDRLSVFANRLVYGEREAPDEALRSWGSRLSRAIPLDELLLQLAESLRKTMGVAAEVWTGGHRHYERVASVPERGTAVIRLSPEEEPVLSRAGVVGPGWLAVWLPELLAGRDPAPLRVAPVLNSGELLGLLVVERRPGDEEFTADDDRVLTELARQVGLALHNVQLDTALQASLDEVRRQAEELRASRARIVAAADASRREIERNLHDGAQQHLVAMAVKMRLAMQMVDTDAGAARALLDELRNDLQTTVQELRDLAHGIYPPLLMDRGLPAALRAAADRASLPTDVDADEVGRFRPEIEAAIYFCCLEAMQNAGKHAGDGATMTVTVREEAARLAFEVADDGRGFDPAAVPGGHGFVNMTDRVGAIGGRLDVSSAPGAGTRVAGSVPLS